jgi:hypothetical protein
MVGREGAKGEVEVSNDVVAKLDPLSFAVAWPADAAGAR